MKTGNSRPLPGHLAAELRALEAVPDAEIDTSDIPVNPDWSGAVRGKFHRPAQRQVTLRLDAHLVDFFEAQGKGYQSRINDALREWVTTHRTATPGKSG